jgi:putative ABC transport system permease protein
MQTSQLLKHSLSYYWRTNLAVILGVATAVAVLAGALLVGDSVRASLRELVVQRLGNTDSVISSQGFFRDQLATHIQNDAQFLTGGFLAACPLIAIEGTVTHEPSKRVSSGINVYGVDERFWKFHRQDGQPPPKDREVYLSESVARELNANSGDSLVLRVGKLSEIPVESLHSRKEELGSTLRLTATQTLAEASLGEFSIQPQQSAVRAVFVPLSLLQKAIDQENKVNLILISEANRSTDTPSQTAKNDQLGRILKGRASLEDYGIKLRTVSEPLGESHGISLEHESKLVPDNLYMIADNAAKSSSLRPVSIFSYLANSIISGDRAVPYSLVTGLDETSFKGLLAVKNEAAVETARSTAEDSRAQTQPAQSSPGADAWTPIILNEWAARELSVRAGDPVSLEYYLWHEDGRLETKTAKFQVAGVVPIAGLAADRDLVPEYPGITETEDLSAWDPPFPVDLKRIRKQDEDYWDQYRTTPKAFIPIAAAQQLWQSRFGKLTSLRLVPNGNPSFDSTVAGYRGRLREGLDPAAMGFTVIPARAQGLAAARGATNFGEYFLYFSFFLVISALLLTALFFKLGIEQRLREIGLLQTVGFPAAKIRRLFLAEGMMLAIIGSLIGLAGALAYGALMMFGLRTWWVDAVGTTMLSLHVSAVSLMAGAVGGVVAALFCIVWTLRKVGKQSTRSLLTGAMAQPEGGSGRRLKTQQSSKSAAARRLFNFTAMRAAILFGLAGLALLIASALNAVGQAAGFFGGAMLLLTASLCYQSAWLRREGKPINGTGWWPVSRLGFRNATSRPGRSVLCIALIASAAFIIVSVDSFRHRAGAAQLERKSGSGGFPLLAESLLPIVYDPNTSEGRESLNFTGDDSSTQLSGVTFSRFRVRPGDDASCLNLYQPANPRIIAPTDDFVRSNRFVFQDSMAGSSEENENPWLLLNRKFSDGAVPVVADANSLTYVLHLKLGEDLVLNRESGPVRLRFVGALAGSILQSELVMAEGNFLRLFPEQEGYRFFLIDTPQPEQTAEVARVLEDRLSDFGFDVAPTAERLENFHRVENTYLSTFQMLGGLGLVLGTLGMAAVLLRNVIERRRELALLRAVGYNSSHFTLMVVAENALLLFCGLITGSACALLAVAPVFFSRHAQLPGASLALLLLAVLISGLTASIVATWVALRSPLLPALRAE